MQRAIRHNAELHKNGTNKHREERTRTQECSPWSPNTDARETINSASKIGAKAIHLHLRFKHNQHILY